MKFTQHCAGQQGKKSSRQCTDGFPAIQEFLDPTVEGVYLNSIRLIPDMNFTCSGTIVRVIVAGMPIKFNDGISPRPRSAMNLQIWRENTTKLGRYHKAEDISLPSVCKMNTRMLKKRVSGMCNGIGVCYECTLRMNMKISVESGDILGIKLPPRRNANFELYFTESLLTNYIFERALPATIDLSSRINETAVRPLITIEVVPGI